MWYLEIGGFYNIKNKKIFGRNIFIEHTNKEEFNNMVKRFNKSFISLHSSPLVTKCR